MSFDASIRCSSSSFTSGIEMASLQESILNFALNRPKLVIVAAVLITMVSQKRDPGGETS